MASEEEEEHEHKSTGFLVDLAADDGAKEEMGLAIPLQLTQVLARKGGDEEEGRR